jgi:beta-lactamase class A
MSVLLKIACGGSFLSLFWMACTPAKKIQPPAPVAIMPIEKKDSVVPAPPPDPAKNSPFLIQLMQQHPVLAEVAKNKKELNVQIIYTQIDRGDNGMPKLQHHYYNVDANAYFYPASTVKFPTSILALQRLNELKDKGIDRQTTMLTGSAAPDQLAVLNDPTTPDGKPNIAHYIKKILLVSDNDAYNRLYEFLGPAYINSQMAQKGYSSVQFVHRLERALSLEENRKTNPINFVDAANKTIYQQPMQTDNSERPVRHDSLGNDYYSKGKLVGKPMDFSNKNRISLEDLHQVLTSIIFPAKVTANSRFNITEDDRRFLLKYMSQLPTESNWPPYADDPVNYYPSYCKFLMTGSGKEPIPANIRIFNKVGDAYGQLLDAAYIVDFDNGVEFMLSAVIYCNKDGVLNDDKYDYDAVGYPFMKALGEMIYKHEVKREKPVLPDLSEFKFEYDKK